MLLHPSDTTDAVIPNWECAGLCKYATLTMSNKISWLCVMLQLARIVLITGPTGVGNGNATSRRRIGNYSGNYETCT